MSVPTSAAEREAARLKAELQEARNERDELRKAGAGTSVDVRFRGVNIPAIIAALAGLGGLGLGANATFRQDKAPPEAITAVSTRQADAQKTLDGLREWSLAWSRYERERLAAEQCQRRQEAAALYRLGYRLPSLPAPTDVHWLSEYKDEPNQVRRTPQYRPEADCPPAPSPPTP